MEHLTWTPDTTLKESPESPTLRVQSTAEFSSFPGSIAPGNGASFRGWTILEQLPTKGAEADIYLVRVEQTPCVLKLYRHRLEPKLEILNRVAEISRTYSRCFVVFRDVGFDEHTGRWYELQEYMPLGSLRDIPAEAKRLPGFFKDLVSELAEAIHCLHLHEIIHCDIKPANVLVRSFDPSGLRPLDLVLTDFGISSILAADMSQKMTSLKGTPMYWAPEAFSRVIGRPCDWWGLGMIVLELLVGEHPFQGLTDSQIIHKLTIGNVEVPDSVEPDWALLVKGLLTKDDARRWGHSEVVRWLSGARDIPVYYENLTTAESLSGQTPSYVKTPFRFEGRDYATMEELARAFAGQEKPWLSGSNYLRYVRQWLENNMLFDEATELGNMAAKTDAERALFRFVHGNARCPFSLLGKLVDVDNLYLFLGRVIRREASGTEARIIDMLGNGQLLSFYDEYVALSDAKTPGTETPGMNTAGERDPLLHRLLLFMDRKTLLEQWEYFQALRNPDAYFWPDSSNDPARKNVEIVLAVLEDMGAAPLKRETLETLKKSYILPRSLLRLFHSPKTYAEGVARLEFCRNKELLFPRDFISEPSMYENLSFDEYAQAARIRRLGHTSAIIEKLDFLIDALPALHVNELWTARFTHTANQLKKLKDREITSTDSLFIAKISGLLTERRRFERGRGVQYGIAGFSGGLVLWLIRFALGKNSDLLFMLVYMLVLGGIALGLVTYSERVRSLLMKAGWGQRHGGWGGDTFNPIALFFVIFLLTSFMSFGRLTASFPNLFPFLIGILPGCALGYGLDQYVLSRNARRILDACASYDSYAEREGGQRP
ncbi:MAG: protein kinase [Synergistaceae bacterium]|jgi:serine/threonine protein kinase|nr:protein kinase [Synergistaceae bacterium]